MPDEMVKLHALDIELLSDPASKVLPPKKSSSITVDAIIVVNSSKSNDLYSSIFFFILKVLTIIWIFGTRWLMYLKLSILVTILRLCFHASPFQRVIPVPKILRKPPMKNYSLRQKRAWSDSKKTCMNLGEKRQIWTQYAKLVSVASKYEGIV